MSMKIRARVLQMSGLPVQSELRCNALAGVKARRWRLGSQSRVGRVTWTGSDVGAGLPTRRFYYVRVLLRG